MFGAGGGTSSYREVEETDVILLWGSNARETHPIFFHHVLKAVRRGAKLYVVDPRRTSTSFGMFSCSKATNEMNFLAQKFARQVMNTNNIDSCNRT